jgi:hypothetical protein
MPVISDIGAHVKALLVEVGRRAKLSAAAARGLSGEAFTKQASLSPVVSSGLLAVDVLAGAAAAGSESFRFVVAGGRATTPTRRLSVLPALEEGTLGAERAREIIHDGPYPGRALEIAVCEQPEG